MSDFILHGRAGDSVFLLEPRSDAARDWVEEHLWVEPWQWLGRSLSLEHRFVALVVESLEMEGLSVNQGALATAAGKP